MAGRSGLGRVQREIAQMAKNASIADEGSLQWGLCEPGQGGNTAAISLRFFVWGPLVGDRKRIAVKFSICNSLRNDRHPNRD